MLLSRDINQGDYVIRNYQPGKIGVNSDFYQHSIILSSTQLIDDWLPQTVAQLTDQHIQTILTLDPKIVIVGTGAKLIFPAMSIFAELINRNIGLEIMDTGAACRTFNVLTAEGRNVVAALLIH